jgi:hypothetical protein
MLTHRRCAILTGSLYTDIFTIFTKSLYTYACIGIMLSSHNIFIKSVKCAAIYCNPFVYAAGSWQRGEREAGIPRIARNRGGGKRERERERERARARERERERESKRERVCVSVCERERPRALFATPAAMVMDSRTCIASPHART